MGRQKMFFTKADGRDRLSSSGQLTEHFLMLRDRQQGLWDRHEMTQPSRLQPWYPHRHLSSRSPKGRLLCPPREEFGLLVPVSQPKGREQGSSVGWPPAELMEVEANAK